MVVVVVGVEAVVDWRKYLVFFKKKSLRIWAKSESKLRIQNVFSSFAGGFGK